MIKIKDFSIESGFSIRMLRYLEEVGVLIPQRDSNNYRVYSKDQIGEALTIKKLQRLGLQLKEIESLKSSDAQSQINILSNALKREQEIAEIKSDSMPMLKEIIKFLSRDKGGISSFFNQQKIESRKMRTLAGDEKFHRTAYNIPILKNIYEDNLVNNANLKLVTTDLLKFGEWFETSNYLPEVYSVLKESSFVFGNQLTQHFLESYESSWAKFLPKMGFIKIDGFVRDDIHQLMGPHEIIIRTRFQYEYTGTDGEIVIPYTPIYTMSQLANEMS